MNMKTEPTALAAGLVNAKSNGSGPTRARTAHDALTFEHGLQQRRTSVDLFIRPDADAQTI